MTPAKQAKAAGLKSLAQVERMLGIKANGKPVVPRETLNNWNKNKPELFRIVLIGCTNDAIKTND